MSRLCPTLWDPMDYSPPGSSVHGIFQARNTGVGCHFLLQRILLTQGSNLHLLCLLHWLVDSSPLTSLCANRNRPSSGWLVSTMAVASSVPNVTHNQSPENTPQAASVFSRWPHPPSPGVCEWQSRGLRQLSACKNFLTNCLLRQHEASHIPIWEAAQGTGSDQILISG